MNEQDSVDRLLSRAFAADRARTDSPDLTAVVLGRIRARQRLRTGVLTAAMVAGPALALLVLGPQVGALIDDVQRLLAQWQEHTALLAVVAALTGMGLTVAAQESF